MIEWLPHRGLLDFESDCGRFALSEHPFTGGWRLYDYGGDDIRPCGRAWLGRAKFADGRKAPLVQKFSSIEAAKRAAERRVNR